MYTTSVNSQYENALNKRCMKIWQFNRIIIELLGIPMLSKTQPTRFRRFQVNLCIAFHQFVIFPLLLAFQFVLQPLCFLVVLNITLQKCNLYVLIYHSKEYDRRDMERNNKRNNFYMQNSALNPATQYLTLLSSSPSLE